MDILDRLLGHDAWTTRQLLLRSLRLSDDQLDRRFMIGHGSLRDTFVHIIWNMEAWTDILCERPMRPRPGREAATMERLMVRLDAAASEFGTVARRLRDEGRLDDLFSDAADEPPTTKSFGGAIAHLVTHSMHHRAQVLNIMRQLGMNNLIEGDVLGWEQSNRQ
jgi:uncharacterized damage-inducible protein DinB